MNPGSKVSSPHSGFVGRFGGKKVRRDLFLFPPHPIFRTADGWALFSCGGLREPGAEALGFPLSNILTNVLSGPVQRSCTRSPIFRKASWALFSCGGLRSCTRSPIFRTANVFSVSSEITIARVIRHVHGEALTEISDNFSQYPKGWKL